MKKKGLTVAALFITAGAALFGQDTADFRYEARDGMVAITGYTGSLKDISIPAMIDKLPVTAIGDRAFAENQLSSVSIPDPVTVIGDLAFYDNELSSVSIPANLDMAEDSFPGNLAEVYTRGGKSAGTYTSGDGGATWTRRE